MRKPRLKRLYPVQFHLFDALEKAEKLFYRDRKQSSLCLGLGQGERELTTIVYKGTFWSEGIVLYLDCGSGHKIVCNCYKIHRTLHYK